MNSFITEPDVLMTLQESPFFTDANQCLFYWAGMYKNQAVFVLIGEPRKKKAKKARRKK